MLLHDLPIHELSIDREDRLPIQQQLFEQLKGMIIDQNLSDGSELPSTRGLAEALGISRNTVNSVYSRLEAENYVVLRHGVRPKVNHDSAMQIPPANTEDCQPMPSSDLAEGAKILGDHRTHRPPKERPGFWPFIPDRREFPIRSWQELVSRRYRMSRHEDLTYDHATGLPELRELIATNLSTSRGVQCTPDQVVVTNGGQAALDLIFRLILKAGDHVWCEDPGYSGALGAARAMGAVIDPLEVAPETGWTLEPSPETAPKAIYLTPTCQQAFCHIMPQEQRNWLVDYAARHDSWIIEDDFDNEFRPPQSAVPALQGLDGGRRTFYVGTFAKTMFPALRIGYAVVPKPFVAAMADAVFVSGHIANLTMQAALFDFITGGGFARHTARMRRLYERRKLRMLDLITDQLSDWLDPRPQPIGLAVPTLLRGDLRDMDIVNAANKHGLRLPALSSRYHFVAPRQGFLLGYCAMTETELSRNVGALRQIFEETCDRSVP